MAKTPPYVWTLVDLYERGGAGKVIEVSALKLGAGLGLSQQGVSKQLLLLEADGLIERKRLGRKTGILVTRSGADKIVSLYTRLKSAVEGQAGVFRFRGRLFTGLGEGGYYISIPGYKKQFVKLLGFEPFTGTLNLTIDPSQVDLRKQLKHMKGLQVSGFKQGGRSYGSAKCFKATVESKYPAAALDIERTHHGDSVLEVISPHNLRKALGLKEGDSVSVEVFPEDGTTGRK